MTAIILDGSEMMLAASAGVMRRIENLKKTGRSGEPYGFDENVSWQIDIEGAMGEFALAKHLGVFWHGKGKIGGWDVGTCDARTTRHSHGSLIIHPQDRDEKTVWLLTGQNGKYIVRGFIKAGDAKQQKYWKDPLGGMPAFFVPQSDLLQSKVDANDKT
jgi:hypothetical protein